MGSVTGKPGNFRIARVIVFRLYAERRYPEALAHALAAREAFPEEDGRTTYWAACLLGVQGRVEEALAELRRGLDRGLWWSTVTLGDPDLDAARSRPQFLAIARECEHRWRGAQEVAHLQLEVRKPANGGADSPLLIALHWGGGNGKEFVQHWTSAPQHGVILAVPQSSQVLGIRAFGWHDLAQTRQDLAETHRLVAASESFDPGSLVLGGASQGAARAVQCALSGEPFAVRGFIAVVPAFSGGVTPAVAELVPLIEAARERDVRGWMVIGADDPPRIEAEDLAGEMVRRGLNVKVMVVPGLGHDFPPDFDAVLPRAIDHVVSRSEPRA